MAEQNEKKAEYRPRMDYYDEIESRTDCLECATEHRQLAEWLSELKELREFNDKIYDVLAKQFGSPCNCSYAVDEYMRKMVAVMTVALRYLTKSVGADTYKQS